MVLQATSAPLCRTSSTHARAKIPSTASSPATLTCFLLTLDTGAQRIRGGAAELYTPSTLAPYSTDHDVCLLSQARLYEAQA
jgi:hypothetical protein